MYSCLNLALINNNDPMVSYFEDGYGNPSLTWAGADNSGGVGCACALLDTCPAGHTCHCDAGTSSLYNEGGFITNKAKLPVTKVVVGGTNQGGEGSYEMGPVRCGPSTFGKLLIIAFKLYNVSHTLERFNHFTS